MTEHTAAIQKHLGGENNGVKDRISEAGKKAFFGKAQGQKVQGAVVPEARNFAVGGGNKYIHAGGQPRRQPCCLGFPSRVPYPPTSRNRGSPSLLGWLS